VTVDKSLRIKDQLRGRRNVLSREERLLLLERDNRWQPGQPVFGLPKVSTRVHKSRAKKKKKEKEAEGQPQAPVASTEAEQDAGAKRRTR
jgi:small basic protein (TIGR04137 family)